jgi:hypothetical protein
LSYTAEISRRNPTCILLLIDQSGSMADPFGNSESQRSKADSVADVTNKLLQNLVVKCARDEGVRDFFNVGVLGYGAGVAPAFGGALAGLDTAPISQVADAPLRIEERAKKVDDGAGGLVEQTVRFPIWFEAHADNGTPMCQALRRARTVVTDWLVQHPECFPPIVINITDGEAGDGDPSVAAREVTELASTDGNVLLFNVHLSSSRSAPVEFPDSGAELADQYAKLLFGMSSVLPEPTRAIAQQEGYRVTSATRGFTFNADIVALIKFLDIGTRASNLR